MCVRVCVCEREILWVLFCCLPQFTHVCLCATESVNVRCVCACVCVCVTHEILPVLFYCLLQYR